MIYLDNAATTQMDPLVLDEMMPFLTTAYGNPGSIHKMGRFALSEIDKARERVADLISAKPNQIIFTSGGTESNNIVISNVCKLLSIKNKTHVITTEIEHDSILKPIKKECVKRGFDIAFLRPNKYGSIEFNTFEDTVDINTGFVSVMTVNNETGADNPVKEIGLYCAAKGIPFHTDCVQAAGTMKLDVNEINCDFLSLSSHKIHGPKGIGALFVKDINLIDPIIIGGAEQEFGKRGGTENVAGIVGFGKACEITKDSLASDLNNIAAAKQQFYRIIKELLGETVTLNGQNVTHPGKILNLKIDGIHAETLVLLLGNMDVCVSAGSACRSKESEPSHVLVAMGMSDDDARQSVRVSFSRMNSVTEVEEAAKKFAECVNALRGYSI